MQNTKNKVEPTLRAKKSTQVSINNLKSEVFADMTPLEMMIVLNKMQEDLLCSSITDEDTMYRNEIVVFSRAVTKMIIALKNNLNPKNISVIELICGEE
jgi:hypothetical protein